MQDLTLIIRWPGGTETIYLGQLGELQTGTELTTFERWPSYSSVTRYNARIHSIKCKQGVHHLEIAYQSADNSLGQAAENECWGISKLTIDAESGTATAHWRDERPGDEFDFFGKAQILYQEDLVNLGLLDVKKLQRKQEAFRNDLLALDGVCALSGESTPCCLDGAHIIEVKDDGGYALSNGILLRADLHRLFDNRELIICDDGSVELRGEAAKSELYPAEASQWRVCEKTLRRIERRLRERNANTDA